jgi:PAS domain S-box-containing protein
VADEGNFLLQVIDELPVALFAKDASNNFRFVLWNKKQEEVTTIPRENALGRNDQEVFSKESAEYFRRVDEAVIRRGKMVEIPEEIIETEHGGEIWLHTLKVPVFDRAGNRTLVVGISEDITERVHVREQLARLNKNLTEANKELKSTQLQLIQAEKMESVGRLAAGVAHEVKNPLALMLMGVEYLSAGVREDDPNVPVILKEMRDAIERADKIIRGLVDFSSERQLKLVLTDLPALVEHVLLLVRHEITRNSVAVDMEHEKDLPPVLLDPAKFEQVLVNLLMNAIHAMRSTQAPKLDILIYSDVLKEVSRDEGIRTAGHLRSGDEVIVFELKDNGSGIPSDVLPKLFDPFFTTKPTGQGTGLGLCVVRKIIELHGGTVTIENRLDRGAKVRIILKAPRSESGCV